jgi:D-alanyl-D-alanine carboxypeptidase
MISTLADLKTWGKEIATGSLLSAATQAERVKARRFDCVPVNLGYGLGCERINDVIGHNGAIFGFSSVVFYYPPADITIAAVGNESTNFTTPTATFAYRFLQQFPARPVEVVPQLGHSSGQSSSTSRRRAAKSSG